MRRVWDWGFFLGSTVVGFVQGAAVGAMIRGIPVVDGQFAGDLLSWLHPSSVYGGVVVLPVIALYTIGVYWVFRGVTKRR